MRDSGLVQGAVISAETQLSIGFGDTKEGTRPGTIRFTYDPLLEHGVKLLFDGFSPRIAEFVHPLSNRLSITRIDTVGDGVSLTQVQVISGKYVLVFEKGFSELILLSGIKSQFGEGDSIQG